MFEAPKRQLKVSREGILLIKSFEGFRPRAERRDDSSPEGGWVIGYGHTLSAREGAAVSEAEAELLLQYDLLPIARAINIGVGRGLNQHQFDALASFVFSVGVERFQGSDVLQRLNAGAAAQAVAALVAWPEPVALAPALRRRAAERALFIADPAAPVTLSQLLTAPLPSAQDPSVADDATPMDTQDPTPAVYPMVTGDPARAMMQQRYSPYGAQVVGPLPDRSIAGSSDPLLAAAHQTSALAGAPPALVPTATAVPISPPVEPPVDGQAVATPGDEPLVLTPLTEDAVISTPRPVWSPEDDAAPGADQASLFGDDGAQRLTGGPIVRHEALSTPIRVESGRPGAYGLVGAFGLVSFGMSMAAFRLASQQDAGAGETLMIAGVLALIGVVCVGVSAYNLYRRWGRAAA